MRKRAIAGVLWFFSIWAAYEVIWSVAGVPRLIGPILGLLGAGIVVVDPTGRLAKYVTELSDRDYFRAFAAWMREDDARRARTMAAGKRRTAELRLALIDRRMGPASRIDNFAAPRQAAATPGRPEHHG